MHKVGARFWITRIMITWGLLSIGMAFVRGETSFYVMRLLLGAAEAGLFPGVMLYLTYWFGREERARATGYFLLGVCIANIVGGPLGGALLEFDGALGFHGWQWLFVIEGIPAVLLAWVVWKKLPDRPTKAPWLARSRSARTASRRRTGQPRARPRRSLVRRLPARPSGLARDLRLLLPPAHDLHGDLLPAGNHRRVGALLAFHDRPA
jgi:MFS family permease